MLDFLFNLGPEANQFLKNGKEIYITIQSLFGTDLEDDKSGGNNTKNKI